MKILIVTNHHLNSFGGGDLASIAYINALAQISSECHLIYPEKGPILKYVNLEIFKIGVVNNSNFFKKLLNAYLGKINLFSRIFLQKVIEINPDLIVFDNSRASSQCIGKVKNLGKKIITIHHNYEMQFVKASSINLLYRFPIIYYIRKTEKTAVLKSDINLTLTFQDIKLLQNRYDKNKTSIFFKLGIFEPEIKIKIKPNLSKNNLNLKFIITGNLEATQTQTCLLPFLKNEFQLIKRHFPSSRLIIAGKNPSRKIREFCKEDGSVILIPNPINMDEIVNSANIYICPISVGGGLKLRILDGLKSGLPILTHEVSARGYEVFKENGFLFTYSNLKSFEYSLKKVASITDIEIINQINLIYNKEFSFNEGVNRFNKIINECFYIHK